MTAPSILHTPPVRYAIEPDLGPDDFIDVLRRSTLAERRPVDDREKVEGMLRHADLIITARLEGEGEGKGRLVGVARSVTDFVYCLYLSDLAVDSSLQGRGIGSELMRQTRAAVGPGTTCLLLSAPKAISFYEAAGMARHDHAFLFTDKP